MRFLGETGLVYLWRKLQEALGTKVSNTTTINGHALGGNISITKEDIGLGMVTNDTLVPMSQKGAANGVCPLDGSAKIDSRYLPSYIDDVIEVYTRGDLVPLSANWLATGSSYGPTVIPEAGKIYVLMNDFYLNIGGEEVSYSANTEFRWGGSTYVKLTDTNLSEMTTDDMDTITGNWT